jgi:siroheme synthase
MGVTNAGRIAEELVNGGKGEETPVALIRWGTYPQQEMLKSDLKSIEKDMNQAGFKPPALMIVGEVVNLSDQLKPIIQSVNKQELSHV